MTLRTASGYAGLAVLLAYLLPEWMSCWRHDVFVFVNGWDEETYLSWQGVLGLQHQLGYYILHLYGLLHEIGISGAMQNLWSDALFPLLTVLLVTRSFQMFGIDTARAFAYAVLVLFSSVLFNYANPAVKGLLGEYDATALLMAGWELYPSILRTPNPQVSYFLVALALYAWLRWRRFWLLLLPIPVLYYFVTVPYVFVISVAALWPRLRHRFFWPAGKAVLVSALATYAVMATGAVLLFLFVMGYYEPDHPVVQDPWVFAKTRMPQMPLVLLLMLPVLLGLLRSGAVDIGKNRGIFLVVLGLAALASVNLHLVTGFMLSQKNYYDYGLSILFGLMLVVVLEMQTNRKRADGLLLLLLTMTFFPVLNAQLAFYRGASIISAKAAPLIDQVRRDPLHALIPDIDVSSRMAYSTAKLLAPPFSYQYYFPFVEKQCRYYPDLLTAGQAQARLKLDEAGEEWKSLESTVLKIRHGQNRSRTKAYGNLPYCQPAAYQTSRFNLMEVTP